MKDKDLKPDLESDVGSSVSVSGVLMVAVAAAAAAVGVVVVVLKSMAWCWCWCGDWESIIRVLLSSKFSAKNGCLFVLVMEES